ncbi:MAG: hypothetical protein J6J33_05715, partial [Clostridia bacterium]|nr:hypothetical protein [Clostridia bacterium]
MAGKKNKKKKEPKVEKVFESSSTEEQASAAQNSTDSDVDEAKNKTSEDLNDFFGVQEEEEESNLTPAQKEQIERLNAVKSKISKILQSSNIEIIDENIGDEYETGSGAAKEFNQEEYDSLNTGFSAKNKSKELTLTIDEFDYTYVGQYLEEFDLMHIKSIKRIRLQKKYPKKLKKFLIAASIILVVGLGAFLGFYLTREKPVYLKSISLSQTEHDYFVNEIFEYTGLYLNLEYSDGTVKKVKLEEEHLKDVTGKIERIGEGGKDIQFVSGTTASLVFTYEGFDATYTINILKKKEIGLSAIYTEGLYKLKANEYINDKNLLLMVVYDSYG